jgi:hypothetical protein
LERKEWLEWKELQDNLEQAKKILLEDIDEALSKIPPCSLKIQAQLFFIPKPSLGFTERMSRFY